MKNVMKRAWEIYRTLTGDRIAKLSAALKQAWAEAKAPARSLETRLRTFDGVKRMYHCVSGDTFPVKETLKANGYKWHYGMQIWYRAVEGTYEDAMNTVMVFNELIKKLTADFFYDKHYSDVAIKRVFGRV